MKRLLVLPLVISLVCTLALCSYASAASAKPIILRFNCQQPETLWDVGHAAKPWLRAVEKATGNKVKFEEYYAQTLSKGPQAWEATKSGIADVSWFFHNYTPGMTTLADVTALPFMPFTHPVQSSAILWKLYEEFPNLAAQFKDNKILFLWGSAPFFLLNSKREIKKLEDLKGLKTRIAGGPPTDAAKVLGMSPMLVSMPDSYLNLQKGVMDGMAVEWQIIEGFKPYEVAKYYTYFPFYTIYFSFSMNWKTWNSLPPDVQKVFTDLGGYKGAIFYSSHFFRGYDEPLGNINERMIKWVREKGYEAIDYAIPPAELKRWIDVAGKPLWEKWVADRAAEGYPEARKILNRTLELIETYHPSTKVSLP
ncbi:MAG: TRAP transporter substrate-binding protein [Thermodesulfobacteriota bacterium]